MALIAPFLNKSDSKFEIQNHLMYDHSLVPDLHHQRSNYDTEFLQRLHGSVIERVMRDIDEQPVRQSEAARLLTVLELEEITLRDVMIAIEEWKQNRNAKYES